jgi:uncharacterized delta-60 repeat protein
VLERLEDRTLLSAGNLDLTFSPGGVYNPIGNVAGTVINNQFPNESDLIYSTAIQSSPGSGSVKILLAGQTQPVNSSNSAILLERYNQDGSLDTTFGSGGKITTTLGPPVEGALGVTLQPDGKILVTGFSGDNTSNQSVILRYTGDGALDTDPVFGFGTPDPVTGLRAAWATIPAGYFSGNFNHPAAIQPLDGKIVAVGQVRPTSSGHTLLLTARYNTDGTLDTGFGTGGMAMANFFPADSNALNGKAASALIDPDSGAIIVAFNAGHTGTTRDFALIRYTSTGQPDPSFGTNGQVTTDFFGGDDFTWQAALQPDGKIVVAGRAIHPQNGRVDFAVARYNTDGSLDTSFGGQTHNGFTDLAGTSTLRFNVTLNWGQGVVLQSDGKIILGGFAGSSEHGSGHYISAVARFTSTGVPDSSFGIAGEATVDVGSGDWNLPNSMALQPDGMIVQAGHTQLPNTPYDPNAPYLVMLARFDGNDSQTEAHAGGPYTAVEGGSVRLDGSHSVIAVNGNHVTAPTDATDPNHLTYQWTVTDAQGNPVGQLDDPHTRTPLFTATGLAAGTPVTATLTVIDSGGNRSTDTTTIHIADVATLQDPEDGSKTALFIGAPPAGASAIDVRTGPNLGDLQVSLHRDGNNLPVWLPTVFHPTGHVYIYGQGNGDTLNVSGPSTADTSQVTKSSGQITWNSPVTETILYSGVTHVTITSNSTGQNIFNDPDSTDTTLIGGPGSNTFVVANTVGNGVVIDGGPTSNTYIIDLGNLLGTVSIANSNPSASDSLVINSAAGGNAITVSGTQVTAGAQTVNLTAPLVGITVYGGPGDDTLVVDQNVTVPVTLAGGGGTNTLVGGGGTTTFIDNGGTNTIVAGTGTNVFIPGGGQNTFQAASGGSTPITTAGSSSIDSLTVAGTDFVVTGSLTVTGLFTWSGGTISGTGSLNLDGDTILNGGILNGPTINNAGYATWDAGWMQLQSGTFNNEVGATLDITAGVGDGSFFGYLSRLGSTFNNAGLVHRLGGTGKVRFALPFNNDGTVEVDQGTVSFEFGGVSHGTFQGLPGSTLDFAGPHTLDDGAPTFPRSIDADQVNFQQPDPSLFPGGTVVTIGGGYWVSSGTSISPLVSVTLAGPVDGLGGTLSIVDGIALFRPQIPATLSVGTLDMEGYLGGTDNFTTNAMTWGGRLALSGSTTVAAGGTLTLRGGFLDAGVVNNGGAATWTGSSFFSLAAGTTFNNLATGTLTLSLSDQSTTPTFGALSGGPTLNNYGTVTKAAGPGLTRFLLVFNNYGTVAVNQGTLALDFGGTSSGTFTGAAGTTLRFAGPHTLDPGPSPAYPYSVDGAGVAFGDYGEPSATDTAVTIAGRYRASGSTSLGPLAGVTFAGPVDGLGSKLSIVDGTALFTPATPATLSVGTLDMEGYLGGTDSFTATAMTWGGRLALTGSTTVAAGGTLKMLGGFLDAGVVNNGGAATWTGSSFFSLAAGTTFNNLATGTLTLSLDDQNTTPTFGALSGAVPTFNNYGTVTEAAGPGVTRFTLAFNNYGTVEAAQGTLALGLQSGSAQGLVTNAGNLVIDAGSALRVESSYMQTATGSTRLGGGTLSCDNPILLNGGVLTGSGTVAAALVNDGSVNPGGGAGILTILGDYTQLGTPGADTISVTGGAQPGNVLVTANGTVQSLYPTASIFLDGQAGSDSYSITFRALPVPVSIADSGPTTDVNTLTVYGSPDPNTSDYIVKNTGSQSTVTWGPTADQATEQVSYSGIQPVNIHGGAGTNVITDPGAQTTIFGGPGANTIIITATTGNGVVINGGAGSNNYVIDLGSLAGAVTINNTNATATDSLVVNGAAGDNAITASGNQVTAGTQTITDTATLANLTVNGGSGNNQLTVSSLTVPVQSVTLAGGGGTTTYTVSAGTVNIVAGTGVNVLNVSGGTVASITAPAGVSRPLVFAHSYTVLDNGTLSVSAPGVLANDVSANGQALTAVLGSGPAHGTLSLHTDGSFAYAPAANFVGTDTFTYQAKGSDGTLSAAATVTIQVAYHFSGFLPPLNSNLAFGLNRTIPIKFQLTDVNGTALTSLSAVTSLQVQSVDVHGNALGAPFNPTPAGNTGLQSSGGQYLFNWQTKGLNAGYYKLLLRLNDGTIQTKVLQLSASGGGNLVADTGGSGGTGAGAGALLAGDLLVYVDNSTGAFTADELARVDDAIAALNEVVGPYGVTIVEVSAADSATATVVLQIAATCALGGVAEGVLGCEDGNITLIAGWNWYTGVDASAVGAGQYDFETIAMHELGHALGLGHSPDSTSVMYATLAPGIARRTLHTVDLNLPDGDGGPCGLHAALALAGESGLLPIASEEVVGRDLPALLQRIGVPAFSAASDEPDSTVAPVHHEAALRLVLAEWPIGISGGTSASSIPSGHSHAWHHGAGLGAKDPADSSDAFEILAGM